MRISLITVFMLAFYASYAQTAESLPKAYYAKYAKKSPRIDGKIGRKEWSAVPWSEQFVDIEGDKKPAPRYATRMKMLWDNDSLYILAELEEPHLWATLKNYDEIIFQDHDFEIFIDPDDDTNEYIEIEVNALNTIMDLHMGKPYSKGGPMDINWNTEGMRTAVGLNGTLNKNDDTDKGWVIEFAIPFSGMSKGEKKYKPTPEKPWRINFSRVEWEMDPDGISYKKRTGANGKPLPENNWVWSPQGAINMHIPEKWGYLHFVK